MRAENLSVAAAFDLSYTDLSRRPAAAVPPARPGPGPRLRRLRRRRPRRHQPGRRPAASLDELYDQHLITEPAPGRYQLHDLLREHARALAAADDPAESDAAAGRLLDYYLHTALAAGRHFATRPSAYGRPPPGRPPAQAPDLSTLGQAAAWLEAERANLHAAADYAAGRGRLPSCHRRYPPRWAASCPPAVTGTSPPPSTRAPWPRPARPATGSARPTRSASWASCSGRPGTTRPPPPAWPGQLALYGDLGDLPGQAYALNQLGFVHVLTGDYPAAAASHQQALALARSAGDRLAEAAALNDLGLVQQLTGDYPAAAASQQQALALFRDLGDLLGQAYALNELGVVQQETGDYPAAAASQQQALALFRDLGDLLGQARALNDLGLVQQQTGDYPAAAASHQQALALFRDLGNLLGQAEALNRLGELSLADLGHRARPASTTPGRWPSPATSARPWRKHAPWKESATATCKTATPAKPPRTCGRHSRSTSASAPPPPGASSKPSRTTG